MLACQVPEGGGAFLDAKIRFAFDGDHAVILNDPAGFAQVLMAASRSVTGAIAGQAVGGEPA